MIIPIGLQCLNREFKKKIGKDTETLPFDWMFAHPKFVYEILKLLLENKITIEEIVRDDFFNCDKRAFCRKWEAYHTHNKGSALYNTKYDVIFPHERHAYKEEKDKYIRRLQRLKNLILHSNEKLVFMYSSQSSLTAGNFTIDGRIILKDVYSYLTKIYELINMYNNNNKMIVFDSILNEDKSHLHEKITLYEMESCSNCQELLHNILKKNIPID